ncbi:hypothetical protein PTSG_02896 [Salpingoeca rosetta]|uniref:Uncharacterized protein n=1 Tax=Salpingoeca rosetta (strain ATCC 50818 / BSB-021) TaxID=946362 RepID=F2U3N1_SALR5|nr:uncharacterized protein PTSG_02896 [Salpingoeca rosetta]EGD82225.1 hypothetical protein PTSG_02896 [Salpingoeca rosetta]|eukprot:XP_004996408.1 hypothetical protein PTSG_02896 [Salpingoeca rosetta]
MEAVRLLAVAAELQKTIHVYSYLADVPFIVRPPPGYPPSSEVTKIIHRTDGHFAKAKSAWRREKILATLKNFFLRAGKGKVIIKGVLGALGLTLFIVLTALLLTYGSPGTCSDIRLENTNDTMEYSEAYKNYAHCLATRSRSLSALSTNFGILGVVMAIMLSLIQHRRGHSLIRSGWLLACWVILCCVVITFTVAWSVVLRVAFPECPDVHLYPSKMDADYIEDLVTCREARTEFFATLADGITATIAIFAVSVALDNGGAED